MDRDPGLVSYLAHHRGLPRLPRSREDLDEPARLPHSLHQRMIHGAMIHPCPLLQNERMRSKRTKQITQYVELFYSRSYAMSSVILSSLDSRLIFSERFCIKYLEKHHG